MSYIDLKGKTVVVCEKNYTKARLTFDDGTVLWIDHKDIMAELDRPRLAASWPINWSDKDVARESLRAIAQEGCAHERIQAAQVLLTWGGGE